jgi:hypothetical protein
MTDYAPRPPLPVALRTVGWLTVLFGIGGLLNIALLAMRGRYFLDVSALQLFAGIGILRLRRGWRLYQLVCLWLGLTLLAYMIVSAMTGAPPLTFGILGTTFRDVPPGALLPVYLGLAGFSAWEIRVLTRRDVKTLFGIR